MKRIRQILSSLLMICLLFTGAVGLSAVSADAKPALKSIALNKTKATIKVNDHLKLKVSFKPTGAAVKSSKIKWTTSNKKIATVKNGKVTANKKGKVTITAKVGKKKAKCVITVKYRSKHYSDPTQAYTYLNKFRKDKKNLWYWNSSNTSKVRLKSLKKLKRDPELEATAELRAREAWSERDHTRPNGKSCFTAYPKDLWTAGENLAWNTGPIMSGKEVIIGDDYGIYTGWSEYKDYYEGQGHRRNMLNPNFTIVGLACYTKDGITCWAMCLGSR